MCVALPHEVVDVDGSLATVRRGSATMTVSLLATDAPVRPGDLVLVNCGLVVARLAASDAEGPAVVRPEEVLP